MVNTALASRWMPVVGALLAFLLTLPSLGNGVEIDDHLYRARVMEGWSAQRSARHLFEFADPERPDDVRAAMASGELSWWAAPQLRWRYLRPLAALTHHAEFAAFERGGEAWMHLHSVLWMAALAALVGALYRRVVGAAWIAGLATLLYAVNDGHGFTCIPDAHAALATGPAPHAKLSRQSSGCQLAALPLHDAATNDLAPPHALSTASSAAASRARPTTVTPRSGR
jgi:hypothetical protein